MKPWAEWTCVTEFIQDFTRGLQARLLGSKVECYWIDHWVWWVRQHYQNCCKCIGSLCTWNTQWATNSSQLLMTTWRYNPPTGADFEHAGLWSLMFCDRAQEEPIYDLVLCSFALHLLVTWLQWSMGTITLSSQASLVSRIETWHDFFFQRWVNQRTCISPLDVTTSFRAYFDCTCTCRFRIAPGSLAPWAHWRGERSF